MLEVVGGFPEIKHLVAILNRGEQRGKAVAEETEIEDDIQGEVEGGRWWTGSKLVISKKVVSSIEYRCFVLGARAGPLLSAMFDLGKNV
jgi:hypothetical protein